MGGWVGWGQRPARRRRRICTCPRAPPWSRAATPHRGGSRPSTWPRLWPGEGEGQANGWGAAAAAVCVRVSVGANEKQGSCGARSVEGGRRQQKGVTRGTGRRPTRRVRGSPHPPHTSGVSASTSTHTHTHIRRAASPQPPPHRKLVGLDGLLHVDDFFRRQRQRVGVLWAHAEWQCQAPSGGASRSEG